jgi:hypothetical protein
VVAARAVSCAAKERSAARRGWAGVVLRSVWSPFRDCVQGGSAWVNLKGNGKCHENDNGGFAYC